MTDTGPIDLPAFLRDGERVAPLPEPTADQACMAEAERLADALRRRATDTVVRENHETVEVQTLPPDLEDAVRQILEQVPGVVKRIEALEAYANAGQELHAAISGLQQINGIMSGMQSDMSGRIDKIEASLAELRTMTEPLAAFLESLETRRAA